MPRIGIWILTTEAALTSSTTSESLSGAAASRAAASGRMSSSSRDKRQPYSQPWIMLADDMSSDTPVFATLTLTVTLTSWLRPVATQRTTFRLWSRWTSEVSVSFSHTEGLR